MEVTAEETVVTEELSPHMSEEFWRLPGVGVEELPATVVTEDVVPLVELLPWLLVTPNCCKIALTSLSEAGLA